MIWAVWLVSWLAAAAWSDATLKRAAASRERLYRLLTVVGAFLLFGAYPVGRARDRLLWQAASPIAWTLVAITLAGLLITWWARVTLGRLWSSAVGRKADHVVVDTGPYGLVRHPIYSGLILAIAASAALRGTALACAGAVVMAAGCYVKARLEEDFLREQLGGELYAAYARRVPMLVPFLRVSS